MIDWAERAIEDMERIQNVTKEKSGLDAAVDADQKINAAANSLDKPMNLSRPRRTKKGVRERLVDLENKKNEFIIIFTDDGKQKITILNVKHHLEQYP